MASPASVAVERVLFPLLKLMGVELRYELVKYGFYPFGGGKVVVDIGKLNELKPIVIGERGKVKSICVYSVYTDPEHASFHKTLVDNVKGKYAEYFKEEKGECIEKTYQKGKRAKYFASYILVTGESGSIQKAEFFWNTKEPFKRGISMEKLLKDLDAIIADSKVAIDEQHADQLLVFMALAQGESLITVKELSLHFQTMCYLLPVFLADVKIDVSKKEKAYYEVRVKGVGHKAT